MKLTTEEIEKCINQENHTLDLSGCCFLINDSVSLIYNYLKHKPDVTSLNLEHNFIGSEIAVAIAANTSITSLNVGINNIGDEGVKALAANSTLTELVVSNNYITTEGAAALAANPKITMLNVCSNLIGATGAKALAKNASITALDICRNQIGDSGAIALATNTNFISLNVSDCNIGVAGARALVANTSIKTLDISNNHISSDDAKEIVSALKNNFVLVNLAHDFRDQSVTETIKKLLARNKVMPWFRTVRNARLLAQAQRSEDCPMGMLPIEILGHINDYAVSSNHFAFFIKQFNQRPTPKDLVRAKQMVLS